MSTFKQLQHKSLSSTPTISAPSLLRPSRPFVPLSPSEQSAPVTRAPLEHAKSLEYSFDRIPVFPPAKKNTTGLPDVLKAGVENLSGMPMDDVHVHYNSSEPAQVQALAYTQGADIHVGPGQEKHLPHEVWHVVQQKQGRVKPTLQVKSVVINDDQGLEKEADGIGEQLGRTNGLALQRSESLKNPSPLFNSVVQCKIPPTDAKWKYISKTDPQYKLTFTYPFEMRATVSQDPGGLKGSAPDGKAPWWQYFQARHKVMSGGKGQQIYWVQGHLLNDNLHGPGTEANLVPLSNTSNTNMETKGERTAKDLVNNNRVIDYTVKANWLTTPDNKLDAWGSYNPGTGKGLLPGECTAPNSIEWEIWTMKEQPPGSSQWVRDQEVQPPEAQWYNTFPD